MYVHPDGLKPTTGGLDHIYTTDTNRMDDGPEVLVWYTPRGRPDFAAFRVYDWSCSPAYPAPRPRTHTVPAFVTIFELSEPAARCNLDVQTDSNGHDHTSSALHFASAGQTWRFPEPCSSSASRHPTSLALVFRASGTGRRAWCRGRRRWWRRSSTGSRTGGRDRAATLTDYRGRRDAALLRPRGRAVAGAAGCGRARVRLHPAPPPGRLERYGLAAPGPCRPDPDGALGA